MTQGSSVATLDRKIVSKLSVESQDALIAPNSLYSHIPATQPPVPQFPLDPTSTLFGPVDRHSKFNHGNVKMDAAVFNVILSTLLARLARSKSMNDSGGVKRVLTQIMNFLKEYADINENKLYKRYNNYSATGADDFPLVEFYRGVAGNCNALASCCLENPIGQNSTEEGDHTIFDDAHPEDDGSEASNKSHNLKVNEVAEKIWNFCRERIQHNALLRFPRLRITYGVALICRAIPNSAAEILSRALDDTSFRTPIHLFMHALQHMEEGKMIQENHNVFNDSSIRAGELEYILHDAAEIMEEAVKIDPVNVDYQLWHIGCLASCLLVSSGNKIGSGVHLYPSQKRRNSSFLDDGLAHEIRTQLKKYDEVRGEISTAIRTLLTLAEYQGSLKAHLAVTAVLEWKQMIGLLLGSTFEDHVDDIKTLHAFHIQQWIRKDTSEFASRYTRNVQATRDGTYFARNIENDPENIDNWRKFVKFLGSLDPHDRRNNEDWWGNDRDWWEYSVLLMPPLETSHMNENGIAEVILARLKPDDSSNETSIHTAPPSNHTKPPSEKLFDWLPTNDDIETQKMRNSSISEKTRSRCHAHLLPRSFEDILQASDTSSTSTDPPLSPLINVSSISQEMNAYRLYVFCHLYGVDHPTVEKYIYFGLIRNCWLHLKWKWLKSDCDEFRILQWLISKGMNLEAVIRSKLNPSDAIKNYKVVHCRDPKVTGEHHPTTDLPGSTAERRERKKRPRLKPRDYKVVHCKDPKVTGDHHPMTDLPESTAERRERTKLPKLKPSPEVDDFWDSVDWKNISYMLPTAAKVFNQTTGDNAFTNESLFPDDQSSTQNSTPTSVANTSSVQQNVTLTVGERTSTGTSNINNQRRVRPPPPPPKAKRKATTSNKQRRTRPASTSNKSSSENPPKRRKTKSQDVELVATNITAV